MSKPTGMEPLMRTLVIVAWFGGLLVLIAGTYSPSTLAAGLDSTTRAAVFRAPLGSGRLLSLLSP